MHVSEVIANSGIAFGTSGARGLVEDFSDNVCIAFTQAFINTLRQEGAVNSIALAIDYRPSSPRIAAACVAAAEACGLTVHYYGVIPTPALAYQAMSDKQPAIMVTGSHIPFDRNGLKFYRPDGEITKMDENAILSCDLALLTVTNFLLPAVNIMAAENYVKRYLDFFSAHCLQGKRIGLYEHSSAGRDLYSKIFTALGAEVHSLERSDTFVPIDTEAVSEVDKEKGLKWAKEYRLDAIFSTDGDGDRAFIADEHGNWLSGDILGLLCAKSLAINAVAVPVSCNTAIELSGFFSCVKRTKIGSPYVIQALDSLRESYALVAGFEANGGFLLGSDVSVAGKYIKALPTRDALLPGLAAFSSLGDKSLSYVVATLPQRYTASNRLQNVSPDISQAIIKIGIQTPEKLLHQIGLNSKSLLKVDSTDGVRFVLDNRDIVHLRASGNAPELRCYVEAASIIESQDLLNSILTRLDTIFIKNQSKQLINATMREH